MQRYFVTGTGTDVGKSIASAVLVEALRADYWKPVQAGDLGFSDTMRVQSLISNSRSVFHPEIYRLTRPLSPHAAAALDNIQIDPGAFTIPGTDNHLIIEGAGGVMVPLSNQFLVIDLIAELKTEVILVSRNYLGSINHTLLTIEALQNRNIPVKGIIFNGEPSPASEDFILTRSNLKCLLSILPEPVMNNQTIMGYCQKLQL